MKIDNKSMFASIKNALATKDEASGSGLYREILKTPPGHTYIVKLLPNINDVPNSIYHYYNHGWNSFATGAYVQVLSPTTYGERDPISEKRFAALRGTDDELKEKFDKVRRSEKWLVNVYVVDDPVNPENNGKVKILRYGKQLGKVIDDATFGEDEAEFGEKVFDLDKAGCNLKIKVDKQGDFPNYTSSRFAFTNSLELDAKKKEEILKSCHSLDEVFTAKTDVELLAMLDEHVYCKSTETEIKAEYKAIDTVIDSVQGETTPVADSSPVQAETDSAEIDDLLEGLDI